MKKIKIVVLRSNTVENDDFITRYDIKVYKGGVPYWNKSVYGSYRADSTVDLMVGLFEACGITPEVVF